MFMFNEHSLLAYGHMVVWMTIWELETVRSAPQNQAESELE